MNSLSELIGQRVIAEISGLKDNDVYEIIGIVSGVRINDFYFQEKNEAIFIQVAINPVDSLPEEYEEMLLDELISVPLDRIRKA